MLKYACTRVGPMVRNLASSFVPRRHVSGPATRFSLTPVFADRGDVAFFLALVVVFYIVVIIVDVVVVVVVVMSVAEEAALSRDARELPVDR